MGKTREPSSSTRPKLVRAATPSTPPPSSDDRTHRIAVQAYLLAEQRGFEPGGELDDWLAAERAVDAQLATP